MKRQRILDAFCRMRCASDPLAAFTKEQLLEITQAQQDHLPDECIEYLANPELPYQLMRAIRVLLSKNVSFSEIKDYLIKNQKKQAIWIGLYNLKR